MRKVGYIKCILKTLSNKRYFDEIFGTMKAIDYTNKEIYLKQY